MGLTDLVRFSLKRISSTLVGPAAIAMNGGFMRRGLPGIFFRTPTRTATVSELTSLKNTLNTAIDAFKTELAAQSLPEPSLNTSKSHPIDDITYLPTPAMFEARRAALASLVHPHYNRI